LDWQFDCAANTLTNRNDSVLWFFKSDPVWDRPQFGKNPCGVWISLGFNAGPKGCHNTLANYEPVSAGALVWRSATQALRFIESVFDIEGELT